MIENENREMRMFSPLALAGWFITSVAWLSAFYVVRLIPVRLTQYSDAGITLPSITQLAFNLPSALLWGLLGFAAVVIVGVPFAIRNPRQRMIFQVLITLVLLIGAAFLYLALNIPMMGNKLRLSADG